MQEWLQEYLESERDSMFQNETLSLPGRSIKEIDWLPENRYKINLSCNLLERLPTLHSYISYLILYNNKLYQLPVLPRRLRYLRVDGNPLTELPDLPQSLRVLQASFCRLLELPKLPANLEILNVSFNHLRELPPLPEGLYELDIRGNEIQELPYLPESLQLIRFGENPQLKSFLGCSLPVLREKIKRRIAKHRCSVFKEELMMKTWHPDRLWAWINAGFDPDDM